MIENRRRNNSARQLRHACVKVSHTKPPLRLLSKALSQLSRIALLFVCLLPLLPGILLAQVQQSQSIAGAIGVDVSQQFAVTADRSGLVRLFDVSKPGTPALISSFTVPHPLTGVAIAGQSLLLSGQQGVQIEDITNPASPVVATFLNLPGEATVVKAAGNLGFTAVGSTVVLFDIPTGTVLDKHDYSTLPVNDFALSGDYLYILSSDQPSTPGFQVTKLKIQGSLPAPMATWSSPEGQSGVGRMSLVAADNVLYIGSVSQQATAQLPSFELLQDLGSSFEAKPAVQPLAASLVRPTSQGLLLYAGLAQSPSAAGNLGLVDPSAAANTSTAPHTFPVSGQAQALSLDGGFAYLAAGPAGLQVVPFATPNRTQQMPTVSVSTSLTSEQPEQGNLARLSAEVVAGDQVRQVDFLINGQKVASAVEYPFEYRFFLPDTDSTASQTVTACVQDIDGNSACSTPVDLNNNNSNSNNGALSVVAVTPTNGSSSPRSRNLTISAQFSLPLNTTTAVSSNIVVTKMAVGSTPSSTIPISKVTYVPGTHSIEIQPNTVLAGGKYQIVFSAGIRSTSGLSMPASYSWIFNVTPVTDTWINAASGDWNVAANWSQGFSPTGGDNAVINLPGVSVSLSSGTPQIGSLTVAATDILNINGGSLTVTANSTVSGTLNLSSGSLSGPSTAVVSVASMNWTNGTLGGTLTIPAGGVMNIVTPNNGCCNPAGFSMSAATINNSGTVNHSLAGGGTGLYVYSGSVINNAGTWNLNSDVLVTQGDATGSVFNNLAAGKFNKVGGTNSSNWSLAFAGAGSINITSGTLSLNGTHTQTITGVIAIAAQSQLNYGQGGTLDGGKVTGSGTLNFNASTTVEGVYSFAGITDITAGTTTFMGATTIATLNLSGGGMVGTAPVTISGTMNWTNGALGGTLDIPAGAVMNIVTPNNGCCNPAGFSMSGAAINNSGTVNLSSAGGGTGLYVYSGSVINNAGAWNLNSDVLVTQGDASGSVFNNLASGKFNKVGGTNTTNWSVPLAGAGPINIMSGTLSLNGTYTTTITGVITLAGQTQLNYGQGGTLNGGKVTGSGTLNFDASATVEGAYSFAGVTDITSGTTTFMGATTIATLNLSGGVMVGTAPVTISGTMNWTNGALGGTLNIPVGAVLNIVTPNNGCCNPAEFSMSAAIINNSGTVNHTLVGGGTGLYVYGGSVVNNAGVWNLNSDVLVTRGDSTGSVFNNLATGKFTKVGGTNTTNWSVPFAGAGTINILSGTLSLNGTYTTTISGPIALAAETQLNYGQGGTLSGGRVTGSGTLNFNASATVKGPFTFSGVTDITAGTITFTGPTTYQGAITINTLNLSGGTMVGTAPVTISHTMNWTGGTIGGTLNIPTAAVLNIVTPNNGCCNQAGFSLSAATINNSGTVNHSSVGGGTGLYVYDGSVINNIGVWNVNSDVSVSEGDATASVFNNFATGKFNKVAGANTTTWSMPFAGAGPINITSGTLSLIGTYTKTITGVISIATQTQLNYGQGGTLDGGKVTGSGTLNFNASTTVEGTYSFAGVTYISGGTTTFTGATTITTLNLIGGTLIGTAPVTISGTMNWTGGTLGGTLNIPVSAVLNIVTPNNGCCDAGGFSMSAATLNNSGTVNLSSVGGGTGLYVYAGSVMNNAGTWNLTSDVLVSQGDATASVFNNLATGTFNKVGGTNTTNWSVPFAGAGPINITSGTLSLNGTYTKTITGVISIATQAQLNYGQGGMLDGGKVTGSGTLNFNASTTVQGAYSFAGVTYITGGTTTFTGATTITTLNLAGGTMIGTAPVTISAIMNWSAGRLGGTLNIPVGAVLNIVTPNNGCCDAGGFSMSAATLNNSGTVNLSSVGGGTGLYVYAGSVMNNAGTWNLTSDVLVSQGDTTASVFNNLATGTFNKVGGTTTTNWSVPFAGAGPINITSGTLSLNGTYTKTITGGISIATQAQLNYGQGGMLDGGKVTGSGTLNFNASTIVEGTYSFAGVTDITGGTTTFTGATTIATLNLIAGTLIGTAPVTISGTMNWTNGTLQGTLNIAAAAVMNIVTPNNGCCNPAGFSMTAATLNNSGTVNQSWVGGGTGLYVYDTSVINNAGVWNLISDTSISVGDSSMSVFNNSGTLNKLDGANTSTWSIPVNNTGTINLSTGVLDLNGFSPASTLSGTMNIAAAAVLNYAQQGTLANGQANGAGMLNFTTGTNSITGTYKLTVPAQVLGGTLNVRATGTLNATTLMLTNATLQVDGTTSIGNLTVSATGNSSGGTVSGVGSITVSDTLTWNQGSVSVTGTFNVQNMTLSSNSALSFKLGTSALSITAKLTLNGTLTLTPTSTNPVVNTTFQILNFVNNYAGNFLDLNIPVVGTNDYLKESLTSSGLSFTVTQNPTS